MNWSCGLLPFRKMTTGISTVGGYNLQIVVVVDVARRARDIGVTVREQKSRCAVIENGRRPANCAVASRAIRSGKGGSRRGVWGIVGLLPLG